MKIQSLISLAMVASLVTACSDDMEQTFNSTEGVLNATVEGNSPGSRVSFSQQGTFSWSEGDKIGVTTSTIQNSFTSLTLNSGAGTGSGSFSGLIAEGSQIQGYAVYPFYEQHSINSNTLSYYFPASYDYDKADEDYSAINGNSFNTAMCGMIQNGNVLMKHLGGVFCIKIEKMPVTKGKLEFTTDKVITGSFNADLNNTDPFLESTETSTDPNKNTVTIKFNSVTNNKGVFYIPVPTGTYNNVRIKVFDENNSEKINVVTGTNYSISRALAKKLILTDGGVDATIPTKAASLSDAEGELKNSKAVSVSDEITSSETNSISIPAVTATGDEKTSKSLMLENVGSGASLTVNDAAQQQSDNSVDNFTLSIPNNESTDFKPLDVTITMPNTTVTLAGNGGAAKYGTVTASTADNTLIISSGVEIATVKVLKGNVRVNKGATLNAIESELSSVTIYKEEGATITSEDKLDSKFKIVDAEVNDMKTALANGKSYTLKSDLNILGAGIQVPAGKNATLDLNGKRITADNGNNGSIYVYGELTLKDSSNGQGQIIANEDYDGTNYTGGLIRVSGENAKLTMESGNIYAVRNDPSNKGQFGVTVRYGGDFTMTGGKIEAGWFAVAGNGEDKTTNSKINISGGELISTADYAVYLPQSGTTTITGGTINGACGGIAIRRGTLDISGKTTKILSQDEGNTGNWSDGTGKLGNAALVVAAEYGDCTVNISGGTFSSLKNAAVLDKPASGYSASINVTGGTFSDFTVVDHLADDANVNITPQKSVDLTKQIVTKGNVTLNLNDDIKLFNTKAIWSNSDWSLISVQAGTLTIKGNGTLSALKDDCYAVDVRNGATLNIESGVYVGNIHAVYVHEGTANIKGGEYSIQQTFPGTEKPYEFVLNCLDTSYKNQTAKIVVTGGTFHKFNPASNGAEGAIGSTNFCAAGYASKTSDNGETWVVSASQN